MSSHEDSEARRWQIAFERCGAGACCPANTRHRPSCERRAARSADLPVVLHNEWGKHGCLHVLAMTAATLLFAMAISWWVVYR